MKRILYTLVGICILSTGTTSCNENDSKPGEISDSGYKGNLYYSWADEGALRLNLNSGEKSVLLPADVKRNGFFVNKSQSKVLTLSDIQGDYDNESFKVTNLPDGSLITEIKIDKGDYSGYVHPQLSPDDKFILAQSLLPGKVVVIEIAAKKTYFLNDINGEMITDAIWMPDGSVLLGTEHMIYRSSIPFDQVTEVKKMDIVGWNSLAVSPDGQKIAFKGGNHVWMMNAQGANLKQISTSTSEEGSPCFSPDGQHVLVGIQQFSGGAGPWGGYFTMYIIPADGQQYTISEFEKTQNVYPVVAKGKRDPESFSGRVQWLK